MKVLIPKEVADQAFAETNDDTMTVEVLNRMRRENPILFLPISNIAKMDDTGGIILSAICATVYRMFEIQGNLPTVLPGICSPIVMELQRDPDDFLTRKLLEMTHNNPHVSAHLLMAAEAAGRMRPDLKDKVLKVSLLIYCALISQIEADNLKDEIGPAL